MQPTDPAQTSLDYLVPFIPPSLKRHGLTEAPLTPLVSWCKGSKSWRTDSTQAWQYALIQIQPDNCKAVLSLDLDGPEVAERFCMGYLDGRIPTPNCIVRRHESGNLQAHYFLRYPVYWHAGRDRPLHAYRRIVEHLTRETGADRGFTGTLVRNPLETPHRHPRAADGPCSTTWPEVHTYPLSTLTEYIPRGFRVDARTVVSAQGRNCTISESLMKWLGLPSNWLLVYSPDRVEAMAAHLNDDFPEPLPWAEVRGIVKSVVKRQVMNLESGRTQANFARIQSARGQRSGASRLSAVEGRDERIRAMARQGYSQRQIADLFSISIRQVRRVSRIASGHEPKQVVPGKGVGIYVPAPFPGLGGLFEN